MTAKELCNRIQDYVAVHGEAQGRYCFNEANTLLLEAASLLADFAGSGLTPEEIAEMAKAKQENRLVELPYALGNVIYVLEDIYCGSCTHNHKSCGPDRRRSRCPVRPAPCVVAGYEVYSDAAGLPYVSDPGEWDYEEFDPFVSADDVFYATREAAEIAAEKYNAGKGW